MLKLTTINKALPGDNPYYYLYIPYLIKKSTAFDIKQRPYRRLPEDHQVRSHAYLSLNKAQPCYT